MTDDAVFAASAAERRQLADLLESLDDDALDAPSLCAGWSVRTVGAHLASVISPGSNRALGLAVLRNRGNPHRANDAIARATAARPVAEIVALLRVNADSRFSPPVVGPRGPLTDALVHGGDMRVPLGLAHDPDGAHVRMALDFVTGGRAYGFCPRRRTAGLQLVAEDLGASWGAGEQVMGRGVDLLMAACGRAAVLDRLRGDGVETLAARLGR